ncbi:hypothetical protein JKP88DRAFT_348676 [Tribonema minus]|uniref:ER membrane protein complex subunit 1 n=1 Tax=Tribonema minus TaxID=303371 RepID=A0A835YVX9_9STRA|nr:hypothetical protein JKP88DRAFT_348676 [Tribonema minus]
MGRHQHSGSRRRASSRPALLLLALLPCCRALFQDEAGVNDWHKKHIGTISSLHPLQSGSLVVASRSTSVIGALHPNNGTVAWRHVLDERESLRHASPIGLNKLLTITGAAGIARLWDARDGTLLWDIATQSDKTGAANQDAGSGGGACATRDGATVFVGVNDAVACVDAFSGRIKWQWHAGDAATAGALGGSDSHIVVTDVKVSHSGDGVVATGYLTRGKGHKAEAIWAVELSSSGEKVSVKSAKVGRLAVDTTSGVVLLAKPPQSGGWLAAALANGGKAVALLDTASGALSEPDVTAALGGSSAGALSGAAGGALLHLQRGSAGARGGEALMAAGAKGDLTPVAACAAGDDCAVGAAEAAAGGAVFARVSRGAQGTVLSMGEVGEGEGEGVAVPLAVEERGALKAVFPVMASGASLRSAQALVLSADASAALLRRGGSSGDGALATAWVREEALASVESVDFVDHTVDDVLKEHHIPTYRERLELHWAELKGAAERGVAFVKGGAATAAPAGPPAGFGLSKLAIAVTSSGKLCAISSVTGDIVWSKLLPPSGGGVARRVVATRPRSVLGYAPEFALITADAEGGVELEWYDAVTGAASGAPLRLAGGVASVVPLDVHDAEGRQASVVPLDVHDAEGRQVLMLVDGQKRVTLAPATREVYASAAPLIPSLFHHTLGDEGLETFAVAPLTPELQLQLEVEDGDKWTPPSMASLPVGRASWGGEAVVATAYPLRREAIQSPAQVLGDDSLLLKYLNPHLAAVATMPKQQRSDSGAKRDVVATLTLRPSGRWCAKSDVGARLALWLVDTVVLTAPLMSAKSDVGARLTLWLVDTVSGRVLYRLETQGAGLPVHCSISENNVVCTHWSVHARRTEVLSLSLYEGMIGRYGLGPTRQPQRAAHFSSFDAPPPVVLHRAYTLPHAVTALGLPLTSHGITAKSLVAALDGGLLFLLDRRWLDPRRPVAEPSAAEKDERLVQWQPFLPVSRQAVLTYGGEVARASRIVTAPTGLESTSVLLATGLELWGDAVLTYSGEVARASRIVTAPTGLESTSVLLATGLDMFCTRVTPSKTFDLLAPNFNYGLLLMVIVGLAAGNVALRAAAKRKKLMAQWA